MIIGLEDTPLLTEEVVLGTVLRHPERFGEVSDSIRSDDFANAHTMAIYDAMTSASRRGLLPTLTVVMDELRLSSAKEIDFTTIAEIGCKAGTVGGLPSLIHKLSSQSLERHLRYAAIENATECEKPIGPPQETLDRSIARLEKLAARGTGSRSISLFDALDSVSKEIDAIERGEFTPGVQTGFSSVDDTLGGGLPIGQTTIIGARPSVGKTSFALNVARHVCNCGGAVAFFSLEQRNTELTYRILAAEARIPMKVMRSPGKSAKDMAAISDAMARRAKWRLRINDSSMLTAGEIASGARFDRRKLGGLNLVVVDYLQLVRPSDERANRNEQVASSARRIAAMARDLNVPVLLLCQLSRAAAEYESPQLHHLRDSGEIEQVADVVLFLHRSRERMPGERDQIDLFVAKQRNGSLGAKHFEHEGWFFTFHEVNGIPQ